MEPGDPPLPARRAAAPRADNHAVRDRILAAALPLFAAHGYAATPVRAIVREAAVNLAAISYYFGDKAGLYRALLNAPVQDLSAEDPPFDAPEIALREGMLRFMRARLLPLGQGDAILLHVRLRLREILEPTGMLDEAPREAMRQRLAVLLARALGAGAQDADIHRLAFAILSLTMYPYIAHDQVRRLAPALLDAPGAIDDWMADLADYACAMADALRTRRLHSHPTENHP